MIPPVAIIGILELLCTNSTLFKVFLNKAIPLNPPPSSENSLAFNPTDWADICFVFPTLIAHFSKLESNSHIFRTSSLLLSGDTLTITTFEETDRIAVSKDDRFSKLSLKHFPSCVFGQLIFIS